MQAISAGNSSYSSAWQRNRAPPVSPYNPYGTDLRQFDPAPLLTGALPVGLHEIMEDTQPALFVLNALAGLLFYWGLPRG
jgi:hypothetical protein